MNQARYPRAAALGTVVGVAAGLLFLAAPALADRSVRIVVAADEEFRARAGWKDGATAAMTEAAEAFSAGGVRFTIDRFVDWDSEAPDYDLAALHRELVREIPLGEADLLLGLAGRITPSSERHLLRLGHSDTPGHSLVVSDQSGRNLALVIRHELAHCFGVPHVTRVKSIMNEDIRAANPGFDPVSESILRNNAGLKFRDADPLAGCPLEPLRRLYVALAAEGADVADLVAVIGDSHRLRGEYDEAARAYQEALALEPGLPGARLGLEKLADARKPSVDAARPVQ